MKKSSTGHTVVSREEWVAARKKLLEAEKAETPRSDELAKQPPELPRVRTHTDYLCETDEGTS